MNKEQRMIAKFNVQFNVYLQYIRRKLPTILIRCIDASDTMETIIFRCHCSVALSLDAFLST